MPLPTRTQGVYSMSPTRQIVIDTLERMEIQYELVEHQAVFTIEEMDALHIEEKGAILKNLFLRDEKGRRYFLVSICKDKKANLEQLRQCLGSKRLSFASENRLQELLGLQKGSVTPFGLLNDTERKVEYILDNDITSGQYVGVHPNENTATVWLLAKDLERTIAEHGNSITRITL